MSWLRFDPALFHDRAITRAGWCGLEAFIAALALTKERDWQRDERRGWLPRSDFDGAEVARLWHEPPEPAVVAEFDAAILTLATGPNAVLIADEDGSGWWIRSWEKYQPDARALARKREQRLREAKDREAARERMKSLRSERASEQFAKSSLFSESAQDVPVTTRDEPGSTLACSEQPANAVGVSQDVTVTAGVSRHETLRDETSLKDEIESSLVTSSPERGSGGDSAAAPDTSASPPPSTPSSNGRSHPTRTLPPGVSIHGAFAPTRDIPADASNPAKAARRVLAQLRNPSPENA